MPSSRRAVAFALTLVLAAAACSSFTGVQEPAAPDDGGADAESGADASLVDGSPDAFAADASDGGIVMVTSGWKMIRGIVADESFVYFAEEGSGNVHSAALSDGTLKDISVANSGKPNPPMLDNGSLYWTDDTLGQLFVWSTSSAIGPTGYAPNATTPLPFALAGAQPSSFVGIRTNIEDGELQLYSSTSPAAAPSTVPDLVSPFDLAVRGQDVYVTDNGAARVSHLVIGSGAFSLASPTYDNETDCQFITATNTDLYWTLRSTNVIRTVPINGTSPTALASNEQAPIALASSDDAVYWLRSDGVLRRWTRSKEMPETIASGFSPSTDQQARMLTLTSKYVVWLTGDGQILRRSR